MPRDLRLRLLIAFLAVYTIWGSTYLAIRIALESIPPFTMAAARFFVAGLVMYLWARWRGVGAPSRSQWRTAIVTGLLLLLGGNGGVVWAEQHVPSGIAALVVGAEPLWAALLDWLRPGGPRPELGVAVGLVTGFCGVALLISPSEFGGQGVDPAGAAALVLATVLWALGSIYSRRADTPESPLLGTGMNMLAGAVGLGLAALAAGEPWHIQLGAVTLRSVAAWAYLTTFGAIGGFTAYLWLLRHTTLAKASTYAYVNPVVAVFLGWLIADEPVLPRTIAAAATIIAGVVLISVLPYLLERWRRVPKAAVA